MNNIINNIEDTKNINNIENLLENELDKELDSDFNYIYLSNQKRNKNKSWTILEGFEIDNKKKFLKFIKKNIHSNGKYIKKSNSYQFQGNHIQIIKNILIDVFNINEKNIVYK